jgi:hypothetical protein
MKEVMSLEGPVLKVDGQLMLIIPLTAGGTDLMECSRGISEVQGDFLKIVIPESLAGILRIEEGDLVCVHKSDDKFHTQPSNPRPVN